MTLSFESGCCRIPYFDRPLNSIRFSCFGPLVTHDCAILPTSSVNVLLLHQIGQRTDNQLCPIQALILYGVLTCQH